MPTADAEPPSAPANVAATDWTAPEQFDEYRVVEPLGSGSMGTVYLAHDRLLDRAVAIKFLTSRLTETARQRFVIEARAAARIHHPNVMGIYRVGQLAEHPYIVSEYIRGTSLTDVPLPLPWARVLELGIGLARGLATAHRQGVLHRDIKLANAMLEEESGEVKLLDFSLAKVELGSDPRDETMDAERPAIDRDDARADAEALTTGPHETLVDQDLLLESAARLDGDWRRGSTALTQAGTLVGTPHYMAPELWEAEPASRETDVYALGVVLYILCVGRPPHGALSAAELGRRMLERPTIPVREAAPSIDPRLAAIIERCLRVDPSDRFHGGDALREALEGLRAGDRRPLLLTDNPYRGLQAFEAEHRDFFFGRGAELRMLLDRLRTDSFVLVAGDSGVGKSSLCRAGVGPSIAEGAIEPERRWSYASMTPGRHPLRALVSILISHFELDEDTIRPLIEDSPDTLGWIIHKKLGRGTGKLLLLDQFEELVTLGDRAEVEIVGKILAQFAAGIPGVRLLATVRGDFLTRAAELPHIGDELSRAIHLLRPLSATGIREAVVGPAEAMNARYESPAMVDELVSAGIESSLPILQFALAELWEVRDAEAAVITADDLREIGGVTGALARHAEGLMASLLPKQRVAARQQLLRLVTIEDTRASLSFEELVHEDDDARLALEALVRGRLLVVRENDLGTVYELAHEALIHGWGNLRRWLDEAAEVRALRHRLEVAAAEWDRLERPRAWLWNAVQVSEAGSLTRAALRPREAQFLDSSERAVTRGRLARRVAVMAIPVTLGLGYGLVRFQAHADLQQRVDARVTEANTAAERARIGLAAFLSARESTFEMYDAGTDELAREAWAEASARAKASDLDFATAARELERALTLDPDREDVRAGLADALLERAGLAEQRHDHSQLAELLERLALYDVGGARTAQWHVSTRVSIETTPPGASVELLEYRLDEDGRRLESEPRSLGRSPIAELELPQGSYRFRMELEGRPPVLYPLRVGRGESLSLSVEVPPASAIPEGFIYVPAGRFLLGCADETLFDVFYDSVPIHEATTDAFLIARHEVTYGEWIEFLDSTPAEARPGLTPQLDQSFIAVNFGPVDPGSWSLVFPREQGPDEAQVGEPLVYAARERRRSQDWLNMPVLAMTFDLASAYLQWLDRTGRVPGARFCSDREWERAGRGADGRLYPHGDHLELDDANIDVTYGRNPQTAGPDVVGSHAVSRSPFGVEDMAGNAGEWTTDPRHGDTPVLRGGSFFMDAISAHLVGRQVVPPVFTDGTVGMRACASFPLPRPVGSASPIR